MNNICDLLSNLRNTQVAGVDNGNATIPWIVNMTEQILLFPEFISRSILMKTNRSRLKDQRISSQENDLGRS